MPLEAQGNVKGELILIGAESDILSSMLNGAREIGLDVSLYASTDELPDSLDPDVYGVVVIRPSYIQARRVRKYMARMGGRIAQIPLVFVMHPAELDGFDLIAQGDDFILEPVDVDELIARIEAQRLRQSLGDRTIRVNDLIIDLDSYRVLVGNRPVDLTPKEFEVLRMLASSPGKVFSRSELLNNVWGSRYLGGTRTVDVHIRRIRSKIETFRRYVETVHGVGYRFLD